MGIVQTRFYGKRPYINRMNQNGNNVSFEFIRKRFIVVIYTRIPYTWCIFRSATSLWSVHRVTLQFMNAAFVVCAITWYLPSLYLCTEGKFKYESYVIYEFFFCWKPYDAQISEQIQFSLYFASWHLSFSYKHSYFSCCLAWRIHRRTAIQSHFAQYRNTLSQVIVACALTHVIGAGCSCQAKINCCHIFFCRRYQHCFSWHCTLHSADTLDRSCVLHRHQHVSSVANEKSFSSVSLHPPPNFIQSLKTLFDMAHTNRPCLKLPLR